MDRTARVLSGLAISLLGVGVALRVVPAPVDSAPPAEKVAPPPSRPLQLATTDPASGAGVVSGNLFAPSRSAPKTRYRPPDLDSSGDAPVTTRSEPRAPPLRLFGTVLGPSAPVALIDADPEVRGAEMYQVGDLVRDRRIVAVSESTVVLDGGPGRLVLRLQSPAPSTR